MVHRPSPAALLPGRPIIRGGVVARRRLLARLDAALEVGAVWVNAAAGSGKTTLLATWLATLPTGVRTAWLTLQPEHRDPHLFADDLRAVLVAAGVIVDRRGSAGSLEDVLQELVAPTQGSPVVVVLDDVHLVGAESVTDAMGSVLGRVPVGSCLLLSGREDPGLPWSRLREQRAMVEIGDVDLRFDEEETHRLLRDLFGFDAEDRRVASAIAAAEGWAAGLVLAGVALQAQPEAAVEISLSPRHRQYVHAFINESVLAACTPDVRQFLVDTALLPVLEPSLCDLLTGRQDSGVLLRDLAERNLLTEELDGPSPAFRYHALLRQALQQSLGPDALERLGDGVALVVQMLAEQGRLVEATDLALHASLPLDAEKSVRQACGQAMTRGYAATVVRWLSSLPGDLLHSQPDLLLVLARAAGVNGDIMTAKAAVREVHRLVDGRDMSPGIRIGLQVLDASVGAWEGVLAETVSSFRDLLSVVPDRPDDPVLDLLGLTRASLLSSLSVGLLMEGRLEEAVAVADQAMGLDELVPLTRHAVLCLGVRPLALAWMGREQEAAAQVESALPRVAAWQADGNEGSVFWAAVAWAGPPERAEQSLARSYRLASRTAIPVIRALPAVTELRVRQRLGQYDRLPDAAGRAENALARVPEPGHLVDVLRTELLSMQRYPGSPPDLTEQELAVLQAMASGRSRKEVARLLHYSVNTVKTYLRSTYRKLGVSDRTEALRQARAWGLVDQESA